MLEEAASKENNVAAQALRKSLTLIPASRRIAQRALCHVSGMVRKRDLSPRLRMAPDFVAAGTGTVELETKRSETADNFPVGKS